MIAVIRRYVVRVLYAVNYKLFVLVQRKTFCLFIIAHTGLSEAELTA